jgi:hypothetical protein
MAAEYDPTRGAGELDPEREDLDEDPTRGAGERFDDEDDDEEAPVEDPMRPGA